MQNIILIFLIPFLFFGCAYKYKDIEDVRVLEQRFDNYSKVVDDYNLTQDFFQNHLDKFFVNYYKPWNIQKLSYNKKDLFWAINQYPKRTMYGQNHRPLPKNWFLPIIENTNMQELDTLKLKAITINNTPIKNFPTSMPLFEDFDKAGEGYPFDYNQNSSIKVNTPIFISHFSKDFAYTFVQSPFSFGWVKSSDIAFVDDDFIDKFKSMDKVVIIKDNIAINKNETFYYYAKVGTLFVKDTNIKAIQKDTNNSAYFVDINISDTNIANFPIEFNSVNITNIANELIGEFYGWGELLDTRDCSAMTRDFFKPFGIWLPRNSYTQSRYGKYIDLSTLSNKEKEEAIIKKGIPFLSTIYLNGHIMLYIGTYKNKALVFHNTWGIKTKYIFNTYSRKIIGKAIVSTLYAGEELSDVALEYLLINRVKGLSIY